MKLLERFKALPNLVKLEIILNAQIFSCIHLIFDRQESILFYSHIALSLLLLLLGLGLLFANTIKMHRQLRIFRLSLAIASVAFACCIMFMPLGGTV